MSTLSTTKKDFDEIRSYHEDLAAARKGELWGFVNKGKEEVIPFLFEEAEDFFNGKASVKLNGERGFVDSKGKFVKTRIVTVGISGVNLELQAHRAVPASVYKNDDMAGWIDSRSLFSAEDEYSLSVNGKRSDVDVEYEYLDEDDEVVKRIYGNGKGQINPKQAGYLDVEKFMKDNRAKYCNLVRCKSFGEIKIEIPANEKFYLSKAKLLTIDWIFDEYEIQMISAFVYDGKGYEFEEVEGYGTSSEVVCGINPNE